LLRFPRERADIVSETAQRTYETVLTRSAPEYVLNDACLNEIHRLSESAHLDEVKNLGEWRRLWRSLGGLTRQQLEGELRRLIVGYAEDVAGGFNPPVYRVATQVLPPALGLLLTPERL